MTSKADKIREEIGVRSGQVRDLNEKLKRHFSGSPSEQMIVVDCSSPSVNIHGLQFASMEPSEALKMARWIIEMIGDTEDDPNIPIMLPNNTGEGRLAGFIREYKQLCDRWNCMILSEGERVEAIAISDGKFPGPDYWGIDDSLKK